VSEASADLSFPPAVPQDVSPPTTIDVSDPKDPSLSKDQRVLALVYDDPQYGQFWILEHLTDLGASDLQQMATNCTPEKGCEGQEQMMQLEDGTQALSIGSASITNGAIWVSGSVYYDVVGPAPAFTLDDATAIANLVQSVKRDSPSPSASPTSQISLPSNSG
jgi:hypothetical protein